MQNKMKKFMIQNQSGMTLIELLIVLALMAGLAGMALTTVGDMGARGRYDETTARMRLIKESVVGNGAQPGRFLKDMGRLPMVQSTDDGKVLSELWNPGTAPMFATVASGNLKDGSGMDWPEIISPGIADWIPQTADLSCGWNGPYLQVNDPADAKVYDGFGNNWLAAITKTSDPDTEAQWYADPGETSAPVAGDTVFGVLTRGSDGEITVNPNDPWDEQERATFFIYPDTEIQVTVMAQDLSGGTPVWKPLVPAPVWANGESKNIGDCVVDNGNQWVFESQSPSGTTTGSTAPSGPADFSDGGVSWKYLGETAKLQQYVNRLRVALFVPDIDSSTAAVNWMNDFTDVTNITSFSFPIVLSGTSVTPGIRKMYAYAFLNGQTKPLRIGNEVETVDLDFGINYVTLYLR